MKSISFISVLLLLFISTISSTTTSGTPEPSCFCPIPASASSESVSTPSVTLSPPLPSPTYFPGDWGTSYYPLFDGLRMHFRCWVNPNITSGETMILDSGLPFFSTSFSAVIEELIPVMTANSIKRACVVDRHGYGWSQPAPYPFDSFESVRRMRGSLNAMNLCPPFVLLGWSWGSIDVQTWAAYYPSEVRGLITVDGSDIGMLKDPSWDTTIPNLQTLFSSYIVQNNNGLLRDYGDDGFIDEFYGWIKPTANIPTGTITKSQDIFVHPSNRYLTTSKQEFSIMMSSADFLNQTYEAATTAYPLLNIPFFIYTCGTNGVDWVNRHNAMALLSSQSSHHVDYTTTHLIPLEHANLVIDDIIVPFFDLLALSSPTSATTC
ncbi:hypothetical protein CYY_004468 [Polysphondylium violaceum]|uniref:AB hydrolase-1 domain-containing protein n=1 Tax=Polysphondylium violaceum TaxID=133409 RepID=A0A8J4V537_9MYCE|nr:hypothetical protein CYY_004468 [Polysphondylium violaceum]